MSSKGSQASSLSKGSKKNDSELIKIPKSIRGGNKDKGDDNLYYNTQGPKLSYRQKQMTSIEKLQKELGRHQSTGKQQPTMKS